MLYDENVSSQYIIYYIQIIALQACTNDLHVLCIHRARAPTAVRKPCSVSLLFFNFKNAIYE